MKALLEFRFQSIFALVFIMTACLPAIDNLPPKTPKVPVDNLYATARSTGSFYFFAEALELSGLDYKLRNEGPFTVFAPDNGAFLDYLNENKYFDISTVPPEELEDLLLNHIIPGSLPFLELRPEYRSSLLPAYNTDNPLSIYIGRYPQFFINGTSEILSQNWKATNGQLYLVSELIEVPTLFDHLQSNPDLKPFLESLIRLDLQDVTRDMGSQKTVFVPTERAFKEFMDQNKEWNNLSDVPEAVLDKILKYHILEDANLLSIKMRNSQNLVTSSGASLGIERDYDLVRLLDRSGQTARILTANIQADNGVIHIIDRVLLPE